MTNEPRHDIRIFVASHGITHSASAGVIVIVGGLVVPELDVGTPKASTIISKMCEVRSGDPKAG